MTEAVFHRDREGLTRGGFDHDGRFSPNAASPHEGWFRALLAMAKLNQRSTPPVLRAGVHQVARGQVERAHVPRGSKISCAEGKLWITVDGDGEDVVLSAGEFRWFRPGAWLVIEAIAKSRIVVEA